ncbi:MAG: FHA domain-containing protein, partial [Inquilinus sp.]|nr:FHA domain-containing protein [Inquilinus sp.]
MKLTLILSRADDDLGTPIDTRSFDGGNITLGRGDDSDWQLDDPNRHLSKHHCAVDFQGGEIFVTDTSTNGVFVNGAAERLGRGNSHALQDGDTIALGEYQLQARIEADGAAAGSGGSIADDLEDDFGLAPGAGFGTASDPFAEESDLPGHADNPDEDPFAEFDLPGPGGGGAGPVVGDDWTPEAASPGGARDIIPDDFDLLGDSTADEEFALPSDTGDLAPESEFFQPPRAIPDTPASGGIPADWEPDADQPPAEATVPPPGVATPRPRPRPAPSPVAAAPQPVAAPAA